MSGRPPQLLDVLVTAAILVVLAGGAVWMLPDHRRPITVDNPLATMRRDAEAEAAARARPPVDSLPKTASEVDAYAAANGIDADLIEAETAAAQAAAQQQAAAEAAPADPNAVAAGSAQAPAAGSLPGSPPASAVAGAPAPGPSSAAVPAAPARATAPDSAVAGSSTASSAATTGARPPAAPGAPAATIGAPTSRTAAALPAAPAATAIDATSPQWYLVAGAYVDRENAERARARIAGMGYAASITPLDRDGKILFRVRAGPMASRDTAERAAKQLRDANLPAVVQQG